MENTKKPNCRLLFLLLLLILASTIHAVQLAVAKDIVRWSLTGRKGGHGHGHGHGHGRGHGDSNGMPENGMPTVLNPRTVVAGNHNHRHNAASRNLSYSPLAIYILLGAAILLADV